MSTVTRHDQIQFVTQSYREDLTANGALAIKAEIRSLAQSNGEYARLFKHSGGALEAVFSQDTGYLLGESIWAHFGKPYNLIYSEARSDGSYLLVIVKNAKVHFDAIVSATQALEEISALRSDTVKYKIWLFGSQPYDFEGETPILPAERCKFVKTLEKAVFDDMVLNKAYQLLPIDQAIAEAKLSQGAVLIAVLSVLVVIASAYLLWPRAEVVTAKQGLSPEQQLQQVLMSPAPTEQLQYLLQYTMRGMTASGWQLKSATIKNGKTELILNSLGGTTAGLIAWAQGLGYQIQLANEGAIVTATMDLSPRALPSGLPKSLQTLSTIIDEMMTIVPKKSVYIGAVQRHLLYQSTQVSIRFTQLSTDVLAIIAARLSALPITLQDTHINVNNGLLTGTIKLTVIGK